MPSRAAAIRRLYHDWERDQWAAGNIDLGADGRRWPGLTPVVRSLFQSGLGCLSLAAGAAARTLVPLVDAAPTEEQQVFITSQLADAARQVVLFELIDEGGIELPRGEVETNEAIPQGYRELVLGTIPAAAAELKAHPGDGGRFSAVLRLHNVDLEELMLLPLCGLLRRLAQRERMPGLSDALSALERDLARHAGFARLYLAEEGPSPRAR